MKRRVMIYSTLFAVSLTVLGVYTVQVYGLENELGVIADEKIAAFTEDEPEDALARFEIGASVVASKQYVLFGDTYGKVSVFLRHQDELGETHMEGFEFFFAREDDGTWRQTESGACSSEECTKEGLRVLRKLDGK